MANLKVNNYDNLKLRINFEDYWDFYINKDAYGSFKLNDGLYDDCLINKIDFGNCDEESGWVASDLNYHWDKAKNIGYTLYNITYTGVDNGLFTYRKDRILNKDFVRIFQENKLKLDENDTRLKLHAVSGNTLLYEYPLHCEEDKVKFNGGFYQGFFKTECDKYQVLPSKFDDGDVYHLEFTLKKCDFEKESEKTLNDKYPQNKGIFFYLGTRAENKWIYMYDQDGETYPMEACNELGIGNFVEGGDIEKKEYIIGGNLLEPNPDFEGYDPFELGDYTDYHYYENSNDEFDLDDMFDFLDMEDEKHSNKELDKSTYTVLTWCCGEDDDETDIEESVLPFFRGCGCPIKYKGTDTKGDKNKGSDGNNSLNGCDEFGDNYIGDFDGLNDLEEDRTYLDNDLDITDFEYETDKGFNLYEANWYYFYTDNKFLMFDRTKDGKTVANWEEGTQYMYCGRRNHFKGNLFILMNRTKTGYTVANIDELRDKDANSYNPFSDIYDNAFALRITDNGEIGYRLLTKDCSKEGMDKSTIIEGYSFENVIPNCEWVTINVRINFLGGDKMKLMFYVNGKLVYITKELPRINLRQLNEMYDKQEGVPYNISIGGGTQGLAETVSYNYMMEPDRVYPLEQNFAGSFIGYISSFRIYNCLMEHMIIENNYKYEKNNVK